MENIVSRRRLTGILALCLFTSIARAGLFISVDNEVSQDPVMVDINDIVKLSIGSTNNEPAIITALLITEGPAKVDITGASVIDSLEVSEPILFDDITGQYNDYVTSLGYDPVSMLYLEIIDLAVPPQNLPEGALVTDIALQVLSGGQDIVITLLDDKSSPPTALYSQTLRVPEPATILLLGSGVLGLWRRL